MNGKSFKAEEIRTIEELFKEGISIKEIATSLNRREDAIYSKVRQLGLKRNRPGYHVWNKDDDNVMRREYPNKSNAELATTLGVTDTAVSVRANLLGIRKSDEYIATYKAKTCFHKNHVPENKGKKQTDYMTAEQIAHSTATRFKKGDVPKNTKEVGYHRLTRNGGFVELRVNGHRKNFVLLHRLVWEQKYGPIPKGYMIKFRDGDRTNCDINNLYMTSMKDNMKMNNPNQYPKEVADLIYLKRELIRAINKNEKNGNK